MLHDASGVTRNMGRCMLVSLSDFTFLHFGLYTARSKPRRARLCRGTMKRPQISGSKGFRRGMVVYPQPRDWQVYRMEWKVIHPKIKLSRQNSVDKVVIIILRGTSFNYK